MRPNHSEVYSSCRQNDGTHSKHIIRNIRCTTHAPRSLLIDSAERGKSPRPSSLHNHNQVSGFVSFRSFAAMHACLGIIHPNPLQLLLPVCLSPSLLRLIHLLSPASLSPQSSRAVSLRMLTRRNPVRRTLERPAQGRVNRAWRRPGSLVAGWVL